MGKDDLQELSIFASDAFASTFALEQHRQKKGLSQHTPPLPAKLGATCTENLSGKEEFSARNKEYLYQLSKDTGLGAHDGRAKVESQVKLDYGELTARHFILSRQYWGD